MSLLLYRHPLPTPKKNLMVATVNQENFAQQLKEHFERTYGRNTFVSEAWLKREVLRLSGTPLLGAAPVANAQSISDAVAVPATAPDKTALLVQALASAQTLEQVYTELEDCRRCRLSQTRKNIVFGEGNAQARLMFVGESPGEQEDIQGRPFVGKAGLLFDKIVEAMGFSRDEIFVLNAVKCRPPGSRMPEVDEVASCFPFLKRQIEIVRPEVIVALGSTALRALVSPDAKINQMRGHFAQYEGIPVMPTYHPAFLLRSPDSKKEVWEDMKKVKIFLETKK